MNDKAGGMTELLREHADNPDKPMKAGAYIVHALGEDWSVAPIEQRIKAQVEQVVRSGARKAATDAEESGDHYEAERQRAGFRRAFALGHYDWGGREVDLFLRDAAGIFKLFFLLLKRCHPNVTEEKSAAIVSEALGRQAKAKETGIGNPSNDVIDALRWALGNSSAPPPNGQAGPVTMD